MAIDGSPLWRQFKSKVEALQTRAPRGYVLVGRLYLFGRDDPLELGQIETSKVPGQSWTWLQAAGSVLAHEDESKRMPHPDGEWIFVHESHIARVELHYVPEIEAPAGPIEVLEVEEPSSDE